MVMKIILYKIGIWKIFKNIKNGKKLPLKNNYIKMVIMMLITIYIKMVTKYKIKVKTLTRTNIKNFKKKQKQHGIINNL